MEENFDDHAASNRHAYMATYNLLPAQPWGCLDSLLDYHAYVLVWPHFSRTIWHILPCNPWDTKPIISTKLSLENTCKKLFKIGHHLKIEVLKKNLKMIFCNQTKKERKRIIFDKKNWLWKSEFFNLDNFSCSSHKDCLVECAKVHD